MSEPLQTSGDIRFVQFPHPGKEHGFGPSGVRSWPLGNSLHRRSFLQSPAVYRTTLNGPDQHGDVAFWGEWEGEAHLVTDLEPSDDGPRYLCTPNPKGAPPPSDAEGNPPQNTDPFVWGDTIAYIGCRQPTNKKLRHLGRGSVILFGSNLNDRFVLDTVLVVAGWIEHDREHYRDQLRHLASTEHLSLGVTPFHGWKTNQTLRYYAGATPTDPVSDMYSFVPCRPFDGAKSGFARPTIELSDWINPNLRQQARSSEPMEIDTATQLWRQVAEQVTAKRLALATRLELPWPQTR